MTQVKYNGWVKLIGISDLVISFLELIFVMVLIGLVIVDETNGSTEQHINSIVQYVTMGQLVQLCFIFLFEVGFAVLLIAAAVETDTAALKCSQTWIIGCLVLTLMLIGVFAFMTTLKWELIVNTICFRFLKMSVVYLFIRDLKALVVSEGSSSSFGSL